MLVKLHYVILNEDLNTSLHLAEKNCAGSIALANAGHRTETKPKEKDNTINQFRFFHTF